MSVITPGKRIQLCRQNQKLSAEKLSEMANISHRYLQEIEQGSKTPSLKTLLKISKALHVPMDYFYQDNDEEFTLFTINSFTEKIKSYDKEKLKRISGFMEHLMCFINEME